MAITQSVFRTQLNSAASFEIWEAFKGWTDKQFIEAMKRCRRELDFFPSMRQIRQGYKPPANKLEEHPSKGLLTATMPSDEPRDALDAQIDNMSNAELETHFASSGVSQGALKGLVQFYKKQPNRLLFRFFLKDCIKPGWEFMSLTDSTHKVKSVFAGDFDDWNKG
jgi:hypothetical protein